MPESTLRLIDLKGLLADTSRLLNTMYFVKNAFFMDREDTICTCINFSDLLDMRKDFLQELVATIIDFVYYESRQESIIKNISPKHSVGYSILFQKATGKFRSSSVNGQFAELLVFNLLQHHFHAVPVLRKMSLTTNTELERNGADAIHLGKRDDNFIMYIAECKTYDFSKCFNKAFHGALEDVIAHYKEHRNELSLYTYEDFIPPDLEVFTRKYLEGKCDIEVNLVAMVTYNESGEPKGLNKNEKLKYIMKQITTSAESLRKSDVLNKIPEELRPRIHFILFPIHELSELLQNFKRKIGKG